ncbi:Rpn family recombination-promoting nuclease/putative transposase [Sphaerospermopsis torques-reginae]|uniref:Rpn family recombination-promoting nuclease/putative transposase n=1 Tax=Sphaerospermopsis torques-reginae ITEP-024 TaxID=984208 RepID=A0ABX8WUR6_9CYAN|nr:Rpn family recombination-promoting nuclease/putative transposase [Sphaerospermopsis torques-reginae]QYX30160.1 Rpn family recombination-promoting nuclease/putative transposase [Sphaerospermopsis torques-reginae ITEP-024]
MKTDSIFYQIFQTLPTVLFELLGESPDKASGYKFDSVEIKELSFRFDGLFLPPADEDKLIYFVEVQFQQRDNFYWDLFGEIFLYLKLYRPQQNWCAVAIFPNRSTDTAEPIQYQELFHIGRISRIYLDELGEKTGDSVGLGMLELIVAQQPQIKEKVVQLKEQVRVSLAEPMIQEKVLELVDKILVYKFPYLSSQELEAMFGLDELKQTRYFQDVKEEGKAEGKAEGKLEMIPLLLRLGLSVEAIASELNLDIELIRSRISENKQSITNQG